MFRHFHSKKKKKKNKIKHGLRSVMEKQLIATKQHKTSLVQKLHKVQYKRVGSQIILKECKKTDHSKGSTLGKRAGDQAEKAAQHAGQLPLTVILKVVHRIHVSCPSVTFLECLNS